MHQNQAIGINMQPEYEKPVMKKPEFSEPEEPCYDYRNIENAGKYRGVGKAGKIGSKMATSIDAMPAESRSKFVPRDFN